MVIHLVCLCSHSIRLQEENSWNSPLFRIAIYSAVIPGTVSNTPSWIIPHDIIVCVHTPLQALIYPLTVATKSHDGSRKEAAENILQNMREHSSALVQQAIMVSEELIRVAILWHEQWHEGLEDASR